jgi:hypothetical protein
MAVRVDKPRRKNQALSINDYFASLGFEGTDLSDSLAMNPHAHVFGSGGGTINHHSIYDKKIRGF